MTNFDGTIDNRWRPDLESSQRRVREETNEVIHSRELSFVPARRKAFEPHDAQTAALIRRVIELQQLPHGEKLAELLDKWQWMDNFVAARSGVAPQVRDLSWGSREEARMIRYIERQHLYDVTREAALEAVFRYPSPAPPRFFLWLRETIAHRALDKLRGELPDWETSGATAAEAEAMQAALAGFERVEEPTLRDRQGLREWRSRIRMRDVFYVVEEFFEHDPVREVCRTAVGRLPRVQREVIDRYFFDEVDIPEIAARRGVATSTVYNQKASAQRTLHQDDVFFSALFALRRVRDQARAQHLAQAYPDGRLPDGRRLVIIDDAA